MEGRDANLTKMEVGRYLQGVSSLTSEDIAHNGFIRVSRNKRAKELGRQPFADATVIKELEALRGEVSRGGDLQLASGRALTALKAESFSREDRLRTAHEIGAFLRGESEAPSAKKLVMAGQARALHAKQNGIATSVHRSVGRA